MILPHSFFYKHFLKDSNKRFPLRDCFFLNLKIIKKEKSNFA